MTAVRRWVHARLPLLALALALLGLLARTTTPSHSASSVVAPEVRQRVLDQGMARVLVELQLPAGPHVPEGELSAEAASVQRRDIAAVRRQVMARLAARGHRLHRQYASVPLVALEVGADALAELEGASFWVKRVVLDTLYAPVLSQSTPLVGATQAWSGGFDGDGMMVAILDTGVQLTHPFLANKIAAEACYSSTVPGVSTSLCPNGQDEQTGAGAGANCALPVCYHGTHVAGIAAGDGAGAGVSFSGVARGADIMAVQVFSRFSRTDECGASAPCALAWSSDWIAGLERVYALRGTHAFAAANLSLGGGEYSSTCDTHAAKPMIDNLRAAGIATVIAAGNSGYEDAIGAPACISSAISVGATTKSDAIASYSNIASFLSLLAPGSSITSSVLGSGFGAASGTSMAAPHVAGAWAILRQASPGASVSQILSALQSTGVAISDGFVTKRRIRIANALAALPATGASLSAAPSSVVAGAALTATWSGIGAPTATDWIGLYVPGTPHTAYLTWIYVSCSQSAGTARASGSCSFPVPGVLTPGTYELRLLSNDGFSPLATSGSFTVTAGGAAGASLSASPSSVAAGDAVTATWSGITTPTATDWIGLYAPGSADTAYLAWIFVSCAQSPGTAKASGSCSLSVPGALAPGTYALRLFAAGGYVRLATSGSFTVTAGGATGASLSASPASVAPGGTVTATWSGIESPTATDWIGLYAPGSPATAYLAWIYVSCAQSPGFAKVAGSCGLSVPSALGAGTYELRLLANNGYVVLATSGGFTAAP